MNEKRIKPKNKFQKFIDRNINKIIISSIGLIILLVGYVSGILVFNLNYSDKEIAKGSIVETGAEVDKVDPSVKDKLNQTFVEEEIEYIDYEVDKTIDNSMYEDEIIVENKGKFGQKLFKYEVKIVNGKETQRKLLSETIVIEAEDRVVTVGSKKRIRINHETVEKTVIIPFDTIYKEDNTKDEGFENIKTKGRNGEKRDTIKITYTNGIETNRITIESIIEIEPVNKVIIIGTKPAPKGPDSESPGENNSGEDNSGDTNPEDTNPDDTNTEDTNPGDTNTEDTNPGDDNPSDNT